MNDDNLFLDGQGFGFFLDDDGRGFGGETGGYLGGGLDDFLFKPFGADFIKRTRRNLGGSNAQFLGLRENLFVLQTKLLRNVVNTNGHIFFPLPPTGMCVSPSWLNSQKIFQPAT